MSSGLAPGMSGQPQIYYEDLYITESQKAELEYLKGNIDHWVSALVQPRTHIKTLRDYYNGVRDNKDFEYLTENYGIGSPAALKFTNIIKPRVDALVAQLESDEYHYTVSATDDKTIDLIQEEKKQKKLEEINYELKAFSQKVNQLISSGKSEDQLPTYSELLDSIEKATKKYGDNYLSDFEIAAQRVMTYFKNSNNMELRQKLAVMAHDLVTIGECYWRVYYERDGSDPIFEVIKPENFFHNKNTNNAFIDGTDAVVHREYMTHKQVAEKYGKFMTKEQMRELFGGRYMTRTARSLNSGLDLELYYGEEDPVFGQKYFNSAYIVEVVHVEWLATNEVEIDEDEQKRLTSIVEGINYKPQKKIRRTDRYEGTRIGGTVYVNCGLSEHIARSQNDPYTAGFTYGGMLNSDRNGKAYSIVGALKDLQDVYDLTIFYRDNLLANSGVKGSRVNIAGIPSVLGNDFMERLLKFIALKKNGFELIDPTEPGAQLFQHYGEFDNSPDGNSLQAITLILQQIEHQADIIAGTTPQMLGHIEERDAVANVRQGIKQSLLVNQPLFELFRGGQNKIAASLLSMAQLSYRKGRKISYIAGNTSYSFKIQPEKFCFTDYAISINFASQDEMKVEQLKAVVKEFVSAGVLDPDTITKAVLSTSITELTRIVDEGWARKKAENDIVGQAKQQIEQYEKQLKELEKQLNNVTQQLEASKAANNEAKMLEAETKRDIEGKKVEIEEDKVKSQDEYNKARIKLDQERNQLEREQLYMGEGQEREINNTL
jgi:hypothetical protein